MKRILAGVVSALLSISTFATTLYPLALMNPVGSTSSQVISSTGPTTAPVWTTLSLATLGGIVPALSGGTGVTTAAAELARIGAAPVASPTFTGTVTIPSGASISGFAPLAAPAFTGAATFATRPTFNGNTPYDTGNLTIANYLTTATAASTYATIAQATTALAATGGSINGVTAGLTTPAASKVTTLVATSTITPSTTSGIVGTTLADSAQAGSVGEVVTNTTTGTNLTNNVDVNASSISLAAGDWDVYGLIGFIPAGSTVISFPTAAISTISASIGAFGTFSESGATYSAGNGAYLVTPTMRINVSTTTTVFLVAQSGVATSTATVSGLIWARRRR